MKSTRLNDIDLVYLDVGQGDAVLFVPGLGSGHGMFEPQVSEFDKSHRLILPDLRGNGESGPLTLPVGTILDRQCDDIAALLDHLKIERVVLVGVSYGGAVGLHFALRHPERLAGLVVVDTFADIDMSSLVEVLFLFVSYAGLWACYLPKPLMRWIGRVFYRRWPVAHEAIPRLVSQFRSTEAVLQSLAMNRASDSPKLGSIRTPTVGIVGDATRTGVKFMRRAIQAIPGAKLEVVPNSFDPSNLCQPEVFNRLLREFLEEIN